MQATRGVGREPPGSPSGLELGVAGPGVAARMEEKMGWCGVCGGVLLQACKQELGQNERW